MISYTEKTYTPIFLTFFIILFALAALIALGIAQYHLSKSKNKYPGLIIPIVFSFLGLSVNVTISFILSMAAFAIRTFIILLIPTQIPAIIYLIIYFAVRSSLPKNNVSNHEKEMKKMSIQDL